MAVLQLGKGHLYGLTGGTIALYDATGAAVLTGYVSPNIQTLKLSHGTDNISIKGQTGLTTGKIFNDQILECTFDVIPEGTAVANALASASLPPPGCKGLITGLPIVIVGLFADAFNTNAGTTIPWIYEGGGTIDAPNDKQWSCSIPLKRYEGITTWAVVS